MARSRLVSILLAATIACLLPASKSFAQNLNELLRDSGIMDRLGSGGSRVETYESPSGETQPQEGVTFGNAKAEYQPLSRLERDYLERFLRQLGVDSTESPYAQPEWEEPDTVRNKTADKKRTDELAIRQFGYSAFFGSRSKAPALSGGAQDSYVLGVGDEVILTLRGQENRSMRTRVDREGRVVLPEFPPVVAAGRTFGDLRRDLQDRAEEAFLQTEVYVSIGELRSVTIMVGGEVTSPGAYDLTGLSTPIEAIVAAGGIAKTGSLRTVYLIRGNRRTEIDLYDLLVSGRSGTQVNLRQGDQIIVAGLGPTIAVAGSVRREGIFEMRPGASMTVRDALLLAGGPMRGSSPKLLLLTPGADGGDVLVAAQDPDRILRNGDMLIAMRPAEGTREAIFLTGHISRVGTRALSDLPAASALVRSRHLFNDEPYLPMAVVQRVDPLTMARYYIPLDLTRVTGGYSDFAFQDGDRVVILSRDDIAFLSSPQVQTVLQGVADATDFQKDETDTSVSRLEALMRERGLDLGPADKPKGETEPKMQERCTSVQRLIDLIGADRRARFSNAMLTTPPDQVQVRERRCPEIFEQYPDLLTLALDQSVLLHGEVRSPGAYPVANDATLDVVVAVADGLSTSADLSNVELTRFMFSDNGQERHRQTLDLTASTMAQVAIKPGDTIRVSPVYTNRGDGPVVLEGEFRSPGVYAIHRGERLSEVIKRAGGLTPYAYPLGAVITRDSLKEAEQKNVERMARDLESMMTAALATEDVSLSESGMDAAQEMIKNLRSIKPVGRLVAEANPAALELKPEQDIILQPGDRIVMPKRPSHVMVTGEVLSATALNHTAGKSVRDYINDAGGFTRLADESRTFVVLPNGVAQPVGVMAWNPGSPPLPPGSTIVVPRDPAPFRLKKFLASWLDITYKAALSAAAIDVLLRD